MFRGDSNETYVLDAYCPHMGGNLAIGGIVKGDCLQCPFHGWTFEGKDGKCTEIAYTEKSRFRFLSFYFFYSRPFSLFVTKQIGSKVFS